MTTNAHKLQNYQISVKKKRITPKTIKTIECSVKFTNHHSLITNHKSQITIHYLKAPRGLHTVPHPRDTILTTPLRTAHIATNQHAYQDYFHPRRRF